MAVFVRKPAFVTAVQWFPPGDPRHDDRATPVVRRGDPARGDIFRQSGRTLFGGPAAFAFMSRVGPVPLSPGDWLVDPPDGGERYVCPPKFFADNFERVVTCPS